MTSLFGEEFEININKPKVKELVKKVKVIKPSEEVDAEKVLKSKSVDIKDKLDVITAKVIATLGKQRANTICIRDRASFTKYIDSAIEAGEIAIDTETNNSLDPVTCKLMGPCLYVPGQKQVYIPINHINVDTKELLPDQLTEQDCKEEFQRLLDNNVKIIMHNGKFDYEVIKCTCGIALPPYWDTMVGARLLNENELAGLKSQYVSKIDPSQAKYDIENLFDKMPYAIVDPDIFALYAATDSMMTYKLYQLQKEELDKDEYSEHLDLTGLHTVKGLRWVFHNIEMPIVVVTAEMELRGVKIDTEFGKRLQDKYNAQLNKIDTNINTILDELKPIIKVWRDSKKANEKSKIFVPKKTSKSAEKIEAEYTETDEKTGQKFKWGKSPAEILEENINLASPAQLAVLFYDVLEAPRAQADSNKTGKDELKSIKEKLASYLEEKEDIDLVDSEDLETEVEQADAISEDKILKVKLKAAAKLADAILARRAVAKILTTYVEVIPELVKHWPDGRIRFHLNSLGTDTGRYSSGGKLKFIENDEPVVVSGINIQNIPSHNPEIRMLFTAEPGHRIIGSDYSAQEPRMTTFLSNDGKMLEAYQTGKDLYAMIAQSAFDNKYEENLEFWPEGTEIEIDGKKVICGKKTHLNKAGKERRSVGKVLNLAATYGMSGATAGARLGKSADDGQKLLDSFFEGFKGVKTAIDDSKEFLKKNGYVEDFVGRRRRLTDINLDPYSAEPKDKDSVARFNPFIGCTERVLENDPVEIWKQILDAYILLSNKRQMCREDRPFKADNEMANFTFEHLQKIAMNPAFMKKQLVSYKNKQGKQTEAEKFTEDMIELRDSILKGNYYKKEGKVKQLLPITDKGMLDLIAKYKAKYAASGKLVPIDIPDEPMKLGAWTGKIAQAERQCFNARIQGSAASLTKLAMIDIFNDEQLKAWNAHLIITVHDEVLVECPEEYADLVEKRLPDIMTAAAKKAGDDVPQACDPYNVSRWYCDTAAAAILDEFKKAEKAGMARDAALAKIVANHIEIPEAAIIKTVETGCDLEF